LPHTLCGFFAVSQRGQRLAEGVGSFQAEARRLRLFDLEVFFLGTAMVEVLDVGRRSGDSCPTGAGHSAERLQVPYPETVPPLRSLVDPATRLEPNGRDEENEANKDGDHHKRP
jgi:hypothetical protein